MHASGSMKTANALNARRMLDIPIRLIAMNKLLFIAAPTNPISNFTRVY